ncbi:MAG: cobalamin B12-binding domain-containing protein [Magnetococcus sp. DMHC-1]|nr:cobalamin B12-binding domain-containing protein [Magnetococcales bacterium]
MKIALVNPNLNSSMAAIPHGLLSIASTVRHAGFSCDLFDQNVQNVTVETLKKYAVVGFSAMTAQLKAAVPLADQLATHCKIVWGGIHALLDPSSLLSRYPESQVILGEGEYPLVNLLQSFDKGEEKPDGLPGVMQLVQGTATPATPFMIDDLDTLPDADYGLLPQIEK